MSNLFELMVVSYKDRRFNEWLKCFELLFDVTADQITADYNELKSLVSVSTESHGHSRKLTPWYWITLLPNRNWFWQTKLFFRILFNCEIVLKPLKVHRMQRPALLYSEFPILCRLQTCLCWPSGIFGRSFALFSFSNRIHLCPMVLAGLVKPIGTCSAKSTPRSKCYRSINW